MREKRTIEERFWVPLKSIGTVLLFFAALLVVLWTAMALVRFFLGAS